MAKVPTPLIPTLEQVRRSVVSVPGRGEMRGHLIAEAIQSVQINAMAYAKSLFDSVPAPAAASASASSSPSSAASSVSGSGLVFQKTVTLSADVALTSHTLASLLTITTGMPSGAGKYRAIVSYGLMITGGGETVDGWVSDGTNQFATSQSGLPGSETTGQNGFAPSPVTYGPGQSVTFTLQVQSTGNPTIKASAIEAGQPTWFSVMIFADQT
jgi:hypothetical protein